MKSKKKPRVLLIGLGRIGSLLETDSLRIKPCTHAGSILSPSGKKLWELVGVWDENPERIQEFHKQWKLKKDLTASPHFWKDLDLDLAVIATHSDSHVSLAKECIHSGIRNLLVEKPVSLRQTDAKNLYDLAMSTKTRVWINHERRFHPIYAFVKDGLDRGIWGKVMSVYASVLTSPLSPGYAYKAKFGGPLLHDGTHALDVLHWFFGNPIVKSAKLTRSDQKYKIEEQAFVHLEYPGGIDAILEAGGYRKYFQFEIDIQTTKARIVLSNDGHKLFLAKPSPLYKGFTSLVPDKIPPQLLGKSAFSYLYKEIHDFLQKPYTQNAKKIRGSIGDSVEILGTIGSIYQKGKKSIVSAE